MRKLCKVERLNNDYTRIQLHKILKKYFPAIDINLEYADIRLELKRAAQI